MPLHIKAYMPLNGTETGITINKIPDKCPICRNGIKPLIIKAVMIRTPPRKFVQIAFQCPFEACESLFVGIYANGDDNIFYHGASVPKSVQKKKFPEAIHNCSDDFCKIYNEASHAESLGLKNAAGPAYRKALEFLAKDYMIKKHPDREEQIHKMSLTQVIEMFEDQRMITCAKRAAWLGNDETHYIRKWEDKDMKDLKNLIGLTVRWIESELMTEEYKEDMPEGR